MKDKIKILLVDDDPDLIEVLKEELEDRSFNVICALDAYSAEALMAKNNFDCLVTDISMPGRSGLEMVATLRAAGNEIPVYFITGYTDCSREKLNALRPKAIIFKPFDTEEIAVLIRNNFLIKS